MTNVTTHNKNCYNSTLNMEINIFIFLNFLNYGNPHYCYWFKQIYADSKDTIIDEFAIYDLFSEAQNNKNSLDSPSTVSVENNPMTTRRHYQMTKYDYFNQTCWVWLSFSIYTKRATPYILHKIIFNKICIKKARSKFTLIRPLAKWLLIILLGRVLITTYWILRVRSYKINPLIEANTNNRY